MSHSIEHGSGQYPEQLSAATAADVGHAATGGEVSQGMSVDVLPGLEGTAQNAQPVLDGHAQLVVGAEVTGLWHYSSSEIGAFNAEKAASSEGKFGRGTYLGVGDLTGETVDDLRKNGSLRHEVGFTGNVLVFDREQVAEVNRTLRELNGLKVSRMRSSTGSAPQLSQMAENVQFDGQGVDAVLVYMDPDRQTAEMIVAPKAAEHIRVLGRS